MKGPRACVYLRQRELFAPPELLGRAKGGPLGLVKQLHCKRPSQLKLHLLLQLAPAVAPLLLQSPLQKWTLIAVPRLKVIPERPRQAHLPRPWPLRPQLPLLVQFPKARRVEGLVVCGPRVSVTECVVRRVAVKWRGELATPRSNVPVA